MCIGLQGYGDTTVACWGEAQQDRGQHKGVGVRGGRQERWEGGREQDALSNVLFCTCFALPERLITRFCFAKWITLIAL